MTTNTDFQKIEIDLFQINIDKKNFVQLGYVSFLMLEHVNADFNYTLIVRCNRLSIKITKLSLVRCHAAFFSLA